MSDGAGRWVSLGEPLDHLLNRDSKRGGDEGPRGIILPDEKSPGSGNIVICGKAGSGKSTLALQIAHACTQDGYAAGYISLEESPEGVRNKAEGFGWADKLCEVRHMHFVDEAASPKELGLILAHILAKPPAEDDKTKCLLEMGSEPPPIPGAQEAPGQEQSSDAGKAADEDKKEVCPLANEHDKRFQRVRPDDRGDSTPVKGDWTPRILLFSLSPASLVTVREEGALFQERYRQLERLLAAAAWLNEKAHEKRRARENPQGAAAGPDPEKPEPWPSLPLVCVDSLNVFGTGEPVREEYHRLFDLFHRHRIIGVFTVEASTDTPFDSTMTDVVINLTEEEDEGYFVRYFEVEKSRYIPQAYGRHTFKIL